MPFPRYNLFILLLISPLFGASLTFNEAVKQYLLHNYDLQIARQESDKSTADLSNAQRRPNPILSGSYSYLDPKHRLKDTSPATNAMIGIHIDHPIELGGKRDRRIDNAVAAIAYSKLQADETIREHLFTLIDSYYQTQADETDLANAIENRRDFGNLVAVAQSKFDHGFLSEIDLEKLKLIQMDYDKEIEQCRARLAVDKEALACLLSIKASQISFPQPDPFDLSISSENDLVVYAQINRPDCQAARQNIEVAHTSVELEKANALSDLTMGIETEKFAPLYDPLVGVSFSIPLPLYDRNQGAIQKSRITALQASTQQSKVLEQAASEVRQAYIVFQSQQSLYRAISTEFESAKRLKEKAEKIFALRGISILELLDAQKSYREYQKNMVHALIELHMAASQLKLTAGIPLQPANHG